MPGLEVAAAALDLAHQRRHARAEVDEEVRRAEVRRHDGEERRVVLVVAAVHEAHVVEVAREDLHVLVDAPVLHDGLGRALDLLLVPEAAGEEVHLEVEAPARHVAVEVREVRVVVDALVERAPAEVLREEPRQRALARADVARHGDVELGLPRGVGGRRVGVRAEVERDLHRRWESARRRYRRRTAARASAPQAAAKTWPLARQPLAPEAQPKWSVSVSSGASCVSPKSTNPTPSRTLSSGRCSSITSWYVS